MVRLEAAENIAKPYWQATRWVFMTRGPIQLKSAEYCVNSRDFAHCILWPILAWLDLKLSVLSGSRCQRCIYRGIEGEGHWLSHTTQPSIISKHAWTEWICSSVPFQWNSYHRQGNVAFKRASLLRQVSHQCLGAHLRHLHLFSAPLSCKQPSSGGQQQESNIWAKPSHTTSRLCGVVRKRML